MTGDRAKSIFLEAIELPKDAREEFIESQCAGDEKLHGAVHDLLSAHAKAGRFMSGDEDRSSLPVESIGPYKLETLLGEGGWGQVWLGEQREPVSRRVAIKLIRPVFAGAVKAQEVIARFESERRVLAMLDHPGIARMLDAGTIDSGPLKGLPYFVMDYVEGRPITHFADERQLTINERLATLARVCDAVHHAHTSGIIHRDIKPSNVIAGEAVSADRARHFRVRVIDFGIAKALDPTLTSGKPELTQPNTVLGTPTYMAPEQAAGELISTRCDIFSLGVLLFELLVGLTPRDAEALRNAGPLEMRRIIVEDEIPSLLNRLTQVAPGERESIARARQLTVHELRVRLSGDLQWITRRALAHDPEERYASAAALAADIRRHLNHVPVDAARPTIWYLTRKFIRRRRATAIASAIGVVAILLGIMAAAIGAAAANAAAEVSDQEAARASAISQFLREDMLGAITPSMQVGRGRDVHMADVLTVAAERINAAEGPGGDLEDHPAAAAEVRLAIGAAYNNLGLRDEAIKHISRAITLRERAFGPDHPDTLPLLSLLAHAHRGKGEHEAAERILRDVIPRLQEAQGRDHRETLLAHRRLALVLSQTARLDEARQILEPLYELAVLALGEDDDLTLDIRGELGVLVSAAGDADQGVSILTDLYEKLRDTRGPDAYDTVITQQNLASELMMAGRNEEAEAVLADNAPRMEQLHGPHHANTVNTWSTLAMARQAIDKLDDAEAAARHAVRCADGLDENSRARIVADRTLADIMGTQGKPEEQVAILETLLPRIDEAFGPTHYQAIASLDQYAYALWTLDRRAETVEAYREALDRAKQGLPEAHFATFYLRDRLAFALVETEAFDEAAAELQAGYAVARGAYGDQALDTQQWLAVSSIAQARWADQDDDEANVLRADRLRAALAAPAPEAESALTLALAWCDDAERATAPATIKQVLAVAEPRSVMRRFALDLAAELGLQLPND